MAHCAKIENGIVTQVVVISNDYEPNVEAFATQLFGGVWKQTSYNSNFRGKFAGIGDTYDEILDAFIPPKPYESWVLNEETCVWESPVPMPIDDKRYEWDESTLSWVEIN